MRRAGLRESDVTVCPSVCHSQYCIKAERASIMISSQSDSTMIYASGKVGLWLVEQFASGHPERGRFLRRCVRTGDFCDFSTYKPPYLRNGARYDQDYYRTLIGNSIRAFDWYQHQRPWMTLKWPWTANTCPITSRDPKKSRSWPRCVRSRISGKRLEIEARLQCITIRKLHMENRIVTWPMTSSDIETSRSWPYYVWGPLSRKRLEIQTWVQWSTDRKWPTASRMVSWPTASRELKKSGS